MPAYARKIYTGEPGDTWLNETGTVQFQLIVNWHNSCGLCCQYDHQIGPSWPLPYHRGCKCKQILIAPGQHSQPFVDFMEKIQDLDHVQQSRVVGRANLTLIERGVVDWSDVVTRTRVRDFREVVALKSLTTDQLLKAGVNRRVAKEAHASVNTPVHELAAQQRQELLTRLEATGLSRAQIKQALAERLAARVGIKAGPSGPGAMPVTPSTPKPPVVPSMAARTPPAKPDLRKIVAQADPIDRPEVIARFVRAHMSPNPHLVTGPTMRRVESLHFADLEGIRLGFPGQVDAESPVVATVELLLTTEIPAALRETVKRIDHVEQANAQDAFWQQHYNDPSHESLATGGRGTITVYLGKRLDRQTLVHEMGHLLAEKVWGGSAPPADSEFGKAIDSNESAFSGYSHKAPDEDFAESVAAFVVYRRALELYNPRRFAAIRNLLEPGNAPQPGPGPKARPKRGTKRRPHS